jgi:histidyl-tRNA synthetase
VLGGGRYDGLIENLGGPPTPAVGWAAGIERLAMLVDAPAVGRLDAIIAVEDDRAIAAAIQLVSAMRRAGMAVEILATGSPRKRFDKASKMNASVLGSFDFKDDRPVVNFRSAGPCAAHDKALEIARSLNIS